MRARAKSKKKKTIVYTYGVFDLFHRGHAQLLQEAKALGDELVVGVFTDEAARSFKRPPMIGHKDRVAVVSQSKYVDRVVPQTQLQPDRNVRKVRAQVLAKGPGAGWGVEGKEPPGSTTMKKLGGKVVKLKYHKGISTSEIIRKIQNIR